MILVDSTAALRTDYRVLLSAAECCRPPFTAAASGNTAASQSSRHQSARFVVVCRHTAHNTRLVRLQVTDHRSLNQVPVKPFGPFFMRVH